MSKVGNMGKIGKIGKARGYLTSGEVAKKLGIPRRTITYLAKKGQLPRITSFGHYRYSPREIENIAESIISNVPVESEVILFLREERKRLSQELAQREASDIIEGKWVELDYTPPSKI